MKDEISKDFRRHHEIADLGAFASSLKPSEVVELLDNKISSLLEDVISSEMWQNLSNPETPTSVVVAVLREIYLEIAMYQPDAIEGAVRAIAQFPRQMPVHFWDEMLHHQVEEFDHGEMALRDYVGVGGFEAEARARQQSPSAFAIAAVWMMFSHKRDPFGYLGAVYLFDALTPIVTQRAAAALSGRELPKAGFEFITHHATADIAHAEQIKNLINDVLEVYPDRASNIVYGFEYFAHVYPLPCWDAAYRRAMSLASNVA